MWVSAIKLFNGGHTIARVRNISFNCNLTNENSEEETQTAFKNHEKSSYIWHSFNALFLETESARRRKHSLNCAAIEEHNPLQLLVVEEVIETPQGSGLAERVRVQVRIVAVDVAIVELDFIVNRRPQRILELSVWKWSGKLAGKQGTFVVHPYIARLQQRTSWSRWSSWSAEWMAPCWTHGSENAESWWVKATKKKLVDKFEWKKRKCQKG